MNAAELLRGYFQGRYGADAMVRGEVGDWRRLSDVFPLAQLQPPPLPVEDYTAATAVTPKGGNGAWESEPSYAWRRYFARQLDTIVHATLMYTFLAAVLSASDSAYTAMAGLDNRFLLNIIGVSLSIVPSTIFLGLTGRTFGKLIFGLRVLDARGKAPGLAVALKREVQALFQGMALGVPIIALATFIGGFNRLKSSGYANWDGDNALTTWYRRPTAAHWVLMLIGFALWLTVIAVLLAANQDA